MRIHDILLYKYQQHLNFSSKRATQSHLRDRDRDRDREMENNVANKGKGKGNGGESGEMSKPRFQPKKGSVFPKNDMSVKGMMYDAALNKIKNKNKNKTYPQE
ncbi:hypothetical protein LOK49_LG05G02468 [Camellia lanceoleosa]|uniref:Uncharacterized protein n=1 Tax=Camellia lanceoleosa TaxID=1840588 RepID=A0ACC0HPK9_9ERIC|nr:hypothetical protein LOK49_LG05G02468 [Camellia lanceoleosa]